MANKRYKYILGIQSFANQDSGASMVRCSHDGQELDYIAISEERLIRKKYPYVFPIFSIAYCMEAFGLSSLDEIDVLVTDYIRVKRWFRSGPGYNTNDFDYLKLKLDFDPGRIRIITHHMAHAVSVYYTSGFDEAAILVVDGNGSDLETTSYFKAVGNQIKLSEVYKTRGIGASYSAVTNHILGFGTGGEGKTMGLAPYGRDCDPVFNINADLDGIKNDFSKFMRRMPYSDVLNQIDAKNRIDPIKIPHQKSSDGSDVLKPYFARAAYEIQDETERVLVHLANDLKKKSNQRFLCVAGGVGLNSVSNKIILDECGYEDVFIFPACSDVGIPFGLALWGYYNLAEIGAFERKKLRFNHTFTGIEYEGYRVVELLKKYEIKSTPLNIVEVAGLIAEGKVVGWFQGASEYGPRALGHRSILADSRDPDIKDLVNLKVKYRESWRPFAPAVLEEYASEYFDLDRKSPYMLLVADVKEPDLLPSITHVDNTARVQTVGPGTDQRYYDLIKAFGDITGVYCILNTSFNVAGEPIVETPEDALICFLGTEMDYLVLGDWVIAADQPNKEKILSDLISARDADIRRRRTELLDLFCPGYDEDELKRYCAESNKTAEWFAKYRCKYELEKVVLEWIEKETRLLIIGTRDHTTILPRHIDGFSNVRVVGFCCYKEAYDQDSEAEVDYMELRPEELKEVDCDQILISSHEYNFEIAEWITALELDKPAYMIYENTSRSFMDVLRDWPQYGRPKPTIIHRILYADF